MLATDKSNFSHIIYGAPGGFPNSTQSNNSREVKIYVSIFAASGHFIKYINEIKLIAYQ